MLFLYWQFFSCILKISFHCLLACKVSDNSDLCPCILWEYFFLFVFKIFFLSLFFQQLHYNISWCGFCEFLCACLSHSFLELLFSLELICLSTLNQLTIVSSNTFSLILFPHSPQEFNFVYGKSFNNASQVTEARCVYVCAYLCGLLLFCLFHSVLSIQFEWVHWSIGWYIYSSFLCSV